MIWTIEFMDGFIVSCEQSFSFTEDHQKVLIDFDETKKWFRSINCEVNNIYNNSVLNKQTHLGYNAAAVFTNGKIHQVGGGIPKGKFYMIIVQAPTITTAIARAQVLAKEFQD